MKKLLGIGMLVFLLGLTGCAVGTNGENATPKNHSTPATTDDDSLLSPHRILNIAHRGASGYAPEHTIASYDMAQELHGDYLEIDLQMTKDGELIAMHDPEVSRTTNGEGEVRDFTLEDITGLDAGAWFNEENPDLAEPAFSQTAIPSLREIFDRFGKDVNYYIETKQPDESPEMVQELMAVLKDYDMLEEDMEAGQIIIQSFSEESLLEMNALESSLPLIQLISYQKKATISDKELEKIKKYAVGIGANYTCLSKEYVEKVRDYGLLLHPYTVNEKEDMERMLEWGATGMFTNYPDRLHEVIRAQEK